MKLKKHLLFFSRAALTLLLMLLTTTAWADVTYEWNDETKTLTFSGDGEVTGDLVNNSGYHDDVKIVVIEAGVTSIGEGAFYGCSGLTSITIGSNVTTIGDGAFYECSGLTSVTIGSNVTSIGNWAFDGCSGLTSITIPASVTSIGDGAFYGCSGLTSITIESNVTSIGTDAFKDTGWYNNQSDGLLYLSNWLLGYKGEKPTGSLPLNDDTRGIAGSALSDCTGLTSITIPNSVTTIGESAFKGCSGLTSITIPNSVTTIGDGPFSGCTSLASITVDADNTVYDSRNNCNAIITKATNTLIVGCKNTIIPNGVTSIGDGAFYGCSGLTSITIGSNVTTIGGSTFRNCSGLQSITIPNSVTSIGGDAFSGCIGLESVSIGSGVTSIGSWAFYECTSLNSVTFADGSNLKSIDDNAFCNCSSLTSIALPASVTSISYDAFIDTGWYTAQPDGLLYFSNWLLGYKGSKPTGALSIKDGTRGIAERAIKDCSALTSVTIPNSVTSIGNDAFSFCSGLKTVIIGSGVTNIGEGAFYGCNNVDDVYCYADPSTLTWNNNEWDFKSGNPKTQCHVSDASAWSGFTNVRVEFVGDLLTLTSGNCGQTGTDGSDVKWVYDLFSKTLTISGTGQMMYYGSAEGSDSQYHSTAPWSRFDNDIQTVTVGSGVTYIGSYAFAYCGALTSISLPESVIQMGDYVCYSSNIARIEIPCATGAVTLGNDGFKACPAGLQIAVPSTLLGTYQGETNWSTYASNLVGMLSETSGFNNTFATGNYELKRAFKCGAASTVCLPFSVPAAQASSIGKFYTFEGIDKSGSDWAVIMEEANNGVTTDLAANTPYLFVPYIFTGKNQGDEVDLTLNGEVTSADNAGYASWTENSTTGSYWTFQGVFYNLSWPDGDANLGKIYGFAAQSYAANGVSPGDFVKAAAGASIKPFRAFLQFTPGTSARNVTRAAAEPLPATMTVRLVSSNGISTAIGTLDTRTGEISLDDAWFSLDGHRLSGKPSKKGLYIRNGKKVVIK